MKEKWVASAPYLAALAADFYLLPLLMRDTGTAMLLMLCVMPAAAFLTAVIYGLRRGFSFRPAVAALVLFLPAVPLYYNISAWSYALVYGGIVLAGTAAGRLFYGKK